MQNKTKESILAKDAGKPLIVWLASWYPSPLDPLVGDFIQRQAEALSLICSVEVWTVIDDPKGKITRKHLVLTDKRSSLTENRLYIYTGRFAGHFLYKYWKVYKILTIGYKVIAEFYEGRQVPTLIHTHILMYLGLIGHRLAMKWQLPHIISEQWTAYLPEAKPNIRNFNLWSKRKMVEVLTHATKITAVSNYLASFLHTLSGNKDVLRIPNVVDGNIFAPIPKIGSKTRFISISAQSYQKNLSDVLKAVSVLKDTINIHPFELIIVHHPDEMLEKQVKELQIEDWIKLIKPISHKELADLMASCDAMILYSRYETFGCVVIEAMACGIPVLAADIPVLRELVVHGKNGLLIMPESPVQLAEGMRSIVDGKVSFDHEEIRKDVLLLYSYQPVAEQFLSLYRKVGILLENGG